MIVEDFYFSRVVKFGFSIACLAVITLYLLGLILNE